MTIEKEGFLYCLYCDICGEKADESFNEFMDAVNYKKREGWRSQKNEYEEWEDVCPECRGT